MNKPKQSKDYVWVPIEPTEAMIHVAEDLPAPRMFAKVYRAMVAAAPVAPLPVHTHEQDTGREAWTRQELLDEIAKLESVVELCNRNTQQWKDRTAPVAAKTEAASNIKSIAVNHDAMIILTQSYPREAVIRVVDAHVKRQVQAALSAPELAQDKLNTNTADSALPVATPNFRTWFESEGRAEFIRRFGVCIDNDEQRALLAWDAAILATKKHDQKGGAA